MLLGHAGFDPQNAGVLSTRVSYSANATYRNHGTHAEAIEIVFDPNVVSEPHDRQVMRRKVNFLSI
jgi:peptide methionine sulfoxide reductase MsrA